MENISKKIVCTILVFLLFFTTNTPVFTQEIVQEQSVSEQKEQQEAEQLKVVSPTEKSSSKEEKSSSTTEVVSEQDNNVMENQKSTESNSDKKNSNELTGIDVQKGIVILNFTKKPLLTSFYLSSPERVVVDIKECSVEKDSFTKKVSDDLVVEKVRVSQFESKPSKVVRVVIDLKKKVSYEVVERQNVAEIVLKEDGMGKKEKEGENKNVKTEQSKQNVTSSKKATLPTMLVDLEYDEAEITDVLQMLAVKSGLNIIYGPDVSGTVSISLRKVPFDKAFQTILKLKGLVYVAVSENIIRVATPSTLESERAQQMVYTKIFPINYVLADDIRTQLNSIFTAERRTRGTISADRQTNSIIVTDTEEGLEFVEEWIKKLDQRPKQVVIEAQVVDISLDDLKELGVDWSYTELTPKPGNTVEYELKPRVTIGDAKFSGTVGELGVTQADVSVGLPASGVTFQFGYMNNTMLLTSKLAALITQGKAKVLSNPKVTTMSNKTATLLAGEKVPYKTTTISNTGVATESWQFLDAGVKLTVTPIVSPDGWVTLSVNPEVSVPQPAPVGAAPTVRTRNTQVTVMVKNKESLVIGGLISDSDIESIQKVPLLGDLPILGYFFKYKSKTQRRSELVILITPKIVED